MFTLHYIDGGQCPGNFDTLDAAKEAGLEASGRTLVWSNRQFSVGGHGSAIPVLVMNGDKLIARVDASY